MTEDVKSVESQPEPEVTANASPKANAEEVPSSHADGVLSSEVARPHDLSDEREQDPAKSAVESEDNSADDAESSGEGSDVVESSEEGSDVVESSGEGSDVVESSGEGSDVVESSGEDSDASPEQPNPDIDQRGARTDVDGPLVVEGSLEARPPSGLVKVLFGLTGISLVLYLGRFLLRWVLGLKQNGRLVIEGGVVSMEEKTRFVGREVRNSQEQFSSPDVLSVRLERRYPYLLTLLGLICLGLGVIAGIILLLDGVQGEFTPWIVSGVGLLMAGVILDLVFTTLAASMPGQAALIFHLPGKRELRLVGCDVTRAEKVVRWFAGDGA